MTIKKMDLFLNPSEYVNTKTGLLRCKVKCNDGKLKDLSIDELRILTSGDSAQLIEDYNEFYYTAEEKQDMLKNPAVELYFKDFQRILSLKVYPAKFMEAISKSGICDLSEYDFLVLRLWNFIKLTEEVQLVDIEKGKSFSFNDYYTVDINQNHTYAKYLNRGIEQDSNLKSILEMFAFRDKAGMYLTQDMYEIWTATDGVKRINKFGNKILDDILEFTYKFSKLGEDCTRKYNSEEFIEFDENLPGHIYELKESTIDIYNYRIGADDLGVCGNRILVSGISKLKKVLAKEDFDVIGINDYKALELLGFIETHKKEKEIERLVNTNIVDMVVEDKLVELVDKDWTYIKKIKNPTNRVCMHAVRNKGLALKFIKNQTDEMCKIAIKNMPFVLDYVIEQTPELCDLAISRRGEALKYVREQTPELCKKAVEADAYAIEYVNRKTEELCMLAVKSNGMVLEYIGEQTYELCYEAVKEDERALQFIKDLGIRKVLESKLENTKEDINIKLEKENNYLRLDSNTKNISNHLKIYKDTVENYKTYEEIVVLNADISKIREELRTLNTTIFKCMLEAKIAKDPIVYKVMEQVFIISHSLLKLKSTTNVSIKLIKQLIYMDSILNNELKWNKLNTEQTILISNYKLPENIEDWFNNLVNQNKDCDAPKEYEIRKNAGKFVRIFTRCKSKNKYMGQLLTEFEPYKTCILG